MSLSTKKNFQIQSFRQQISLDVNAANNLWCSLSKAIDEIYNQNASTLSFEELYRNAYNMVLHKHGDILYNGISNSIRDHLLQSVEFIVAVQNNELLQNLVTVWSSHTTAFKMIKDILMYMDKTYVVPRKKLPVYHLALSLFKEHIAYHPDIRDRLRLVLLEEITMERQGCIIDRNLLKSVLNMLIELGIEGVNVYEEEFERHFLEDSKQFYMVESLEFLSKNTCPDYLRKTEARLQEEAARLVNYLSFATETKLIRAVEGELIATHAKTIVDMDGSGMVPMMRDDKLDDLRRMYALFSRVPPCLDLLRDGMAKYLMQCGQDIIDGQETAKDPVSFVRQFLELKDKFDKIIRDSFRQEKKAQKRLKEAFEEFINRDNRCAAYLANYVDELLKSGVQGATEEEVEGKLERVIVIFKYLTDKDIFESYYKSLLSKRLLSGKSGSEEVEKSMIAKLKAECGYQFTSKLEGMFVDMSNSKGTMDEYRRTDMFASSCAALVEIDVHMLTTGYWPLQALPPCVLPAAVSSCCDLFTAFYLDKHSGRKLSWVMQLGSADIKVSPSTFVSLCLSLLIVGVGRRRSPRAARSSTSPPTRCASCCCSTSTTCSRWTPSDPPPAYQSLSSSATC